MAQLRCGVLTVSDRCSRGEAVDESGPRLVSLLKEKLGVNSVLSALVADEIDEIKRVILHWCDAEKLDLVVSTGGTGFAPRDNTPEAVRPLLEKEAPGMVHAMLSVSLSATPFAMLGKLELASSLLIWLQAGLCAVFVVAHWLPRCPEV